MDPNISRRDDGNGGHRSPRSSRRGLRIQRTKPPFADPREILQKCLTISGVQLFGAATGSISARRFQREISRPRPAFYPTIQPCRISLPSDIFRLTEFRGELIIACLQNYCELSLIGG